MTITPTRPTFPVSGTPVGMKESMSRADFLPDSFALLVETKGYLLAWERASICPCRPVVTQTEQPDPNCPLCKGSGWHYFGGDLPPNYDEIGNMDEVQKKIIETNNAMTIRGVITSIQNEYSPWDKIGNWMAGSMMLTTRHENKIGYYDKLTILESEVVYVETVNSDGTDTVTGRYPVTGVNYFRSFSRTYKPDQDFFIELGKVKFRPAAIPESGTKLSLHYLCHPVVLVVEHPHIIRQTSKKFKVSNPKTPRGDPKGLPIQALVRYDFIPEAHG
jgi:hypothetical protein